MLRPRRRPNYGPHLCAIAAALLLLLSVTLLYTRLASDRPKRRYSPLNDAAFDDPFTNDPLLQDSDSDPRTTSSDDRIDELDILDDDSLKVSDEEEILRGVEAEEEENDRFHMSSSPSSGYYFDHVAGAIRRAFDKRSMDEIDRWDDYSTSFHPGLASVEDRSKVAFGSDDVPVDEEVRRKVMEVKDIEDTLFLKLGSHVSPLREGWGTWFDAKSDFLRKDKMFKSNLEILNPLSNPLLQDPDGIGVTGLTRGDKIVQKGLINEFKKVPFLGKKPLALSRSKAVETVVSDIMNQQNRRDHKGISRGIVNVDETANRNVMEQKSETNRVERRILSSSFDESNAIKLGKFRHATRDSGKEKVEYRSTKDNGVASDQLSNLQSSSSNMRNTSGFSPIYADGRRWGYFPGLHPHLSFSNFMDAFFRKGKCSMRVFMVWNSPPWMYGIRHQRGLESLLFHHPDACIVVFSETIELDFFKDFVKDGFKIAVAMPNLEELLNGTPTGIFATVWHEWRHTKYYPTHYSELVRLASLYKYGGVYLDSDVIVLKPLTQLVNTIGLEYVSDKSYLNGAVMAFSRHSAFIMECLSEFYSTYDDTLLRWNGAELLTRVAGKFFSRTKGSSIKLELRLEQPVAFFPISSHDILRYFAAPETEGEKAQQKALYKRILEDSYTFHLWNRVTSNVIPDPDSLIARAVNHHCIRCVDVL